MTCPRGIHLGTTYRSRGPTTPLGNLNVPRQLCLRRSRLRLSGPAKYLETSSSLLPSPLWVSSPWHSSTSRGSDIGRQDINLIPNPGLNPRHERIKMFDANLWSNCVCHSGR